MNSNMLNFTAFPVPGELNEGGPLRSVSLLGVMLSILALVAGMLLIMWYGREQEVLVFVDEFDAGIEPQQAPPPEPRRRHGRRSPPPIRQHRKESRRVRR